MAFPRPARGSAPVRCVAINLEPRDDSLTKGVLGTIPRFGVLHGFSTKERGAQDSRVGDFAAQAAADTIVVDVSDGIAL